MWCMWTTDQVQKYLWKYCCNSFIIKDLQFSLSCLFAPLPSLKMLKRQRYFSYTRVFDFLYNFHANWLILSTCFLSHHTNYSINIVFSRYHTDILITTYIIITWTSHQVNPKAFSFCSLWLKLAINFDMKHTKTISRIKTCMIYKHFLIHTF